MRQWVIRVNGAEVGRVGPAQSVEIGRKPLRPLEDDGMTRIDVPDGTRSMSKRHAVFSVGENGSASVRDMASTNGTYVVRDNGELMRLPQDVDFPLPTSPMRMQFGDVPVDFTRIEQPEPEERQPDVPGLFDYAVDEGHREPDAADMSVDDILDLRAGEPTGIFYADTVKHRVEELDAAQHQSFQPFPFEQQAAVPLTIMPQDERDETPRDLFEDARSSETESGEQPREAEVPSVDKPDAPSREHSVWALVAEQQDQPMDPEPAVDPEPVADGEPPSDEPAAEPDAAPLVFTAMGADQPSDIAEERTEPVEEEHVDSAEPADAYTPAFEPGSVFERVSQGGFAAPEPSVEVDGLSSDEAKRTGDFTLQFEMARHPQLLPFLAMNPSLYDDLYAWLAAQGNPDVDEALGHNEGYQEYRKAVGK